MSSIQIAKKIELLPEMLQAQVADYVDFLLNRHYHEKNLQKEDLALSQEQKVELDSRYRAYLENPDSVVSIETMKTRLIQKYGLSTAS
jgi:hypothetical protein